MKQGVSARIALSTILGLMLAQSASAFISNGRWSNTASGGTGGHGDPITLTWGFLPDGTSIPGDPVSDLISDFDGIFGGAPVGGDPDDLTERPWFRFFEESFGRWGELGGITYVYEPNDDGVAHNSLSGVLGVRADLRIGGSFQDGPSNVLAYNYFPNSGDMSLDTGDSAFYGNSSNDYRNLRNVIMHEHGHGMGISHVVSNDADFLMEPFFNPSFDGPQFDDIRAIQWLYGDALEKTNGGAGNDVYSNATSLDDRFIDGTATIGADAGFDDLVLASETDFVSIDEQSGDVDFFSFTVDGPSTLDAILAPQGPTYLQGSQGGGTQSTLNALTRGDLEFSILDTDGSTELAAANATGAGFEETLLGVELDEAGEYFVRVTGTSADNIQFYRLDLTVEASIEFFAADFDEDGDVDGDDFLIWQAAFGLNADGDTDDDGDTDGDDFLVWQEQFGSASGGGSNGAIPEPAAVVLLCIVFAISGVLRLTRRAF